MEESEEIKVMNIRKKVLSAVLAGVLSLSLLPGAALADEAGTPGLENFQKSQSYTAGQFADVADGSWYSGAVQAAYEYGLMQGTAPARFGPDGKLTIGETVAIASRLHATYQGNGYEFQQSAPWYQTYVDYAAANGIAGAYPDYGATISRAAFVGILARALPAQTMPEKNTVADNSIPDVPADASYYGDVYRFYRAGILSGTGSEGRFAPFSQITRSEVAVILSSMVDPSLRKSFSLSADPVTLYKGQTQTISVLPNQVDGYLAQGWSRTKPAPVVRNTPIRILRHPVIGDRDSVGGISFDICWSNQSDKVIKYAHFYVTPYNGVWDPVKCEIRGYSTADCWVTGPVAKVSSSTNLLDETAGGFGVFAPREIEGTDFGDYYVSKIFDDLTYYGPDGEYVPITPADYGNIFVVTYWDRMWYNNDIKHLMIAKVVLEYMDGTTTTLTGKALQDCIY